MNWTGNSPSATQPATSQAMPMRSQPGVMRLRQLLLARLAEEDDAEELDHGIAGERRDQCDQAATTGISMLRNELGKSGEKRKLCSSSHSETKPPKRRQAGAGQHADQHAQATQGM
jgi:hypothetical protein